MKIGILFGGNSLEHEISIVTAFQLKNKLSNEYDIVMLYLDFNNNLYDASSMKVSDFKEADIKGLKPTRFELGGIKGIKIDSIIIAMHGENGEDGIAASLCRFYSLSFVGCDIFASSLAMNKYLCYRYLSSLGLKMIPTRFYNYNDYIEGNIKEEYPIIIKPNKGGSSIGICVANNEEELLDALAKVFNLTDEIVVQRFYFDIHEYNLALYENGYSKLEMIMNKSEFFTFENKYNDEFKEYHKMLVTDRLDEFKAIARDVYNFIAASGIIRIDFFMIDNEIYINEINTIPGALSMYLFDDFISVIKELINASVVSKKELKNEES